MLLVPAFEIWGAYQGSVSSLFLLCYFQKFLYSELSYIPMAVLKH
jgi:hypothetical protein